MQGPLKLCCSERSSSNFTYLRPVITMKMNLKSSFTLDKEFDSFAVTAVTKHPQILETFTTTLPEWANMLRLWELCWSIWSAVLILLLHDLKTVRPVRFRGENLETLKSSCLMTEFMVKVIFREIAHLGGRAQTILYKKFLQHTLCAYFSVSNLLHE